MKCDYFTRSLSIDKALSKYYVVGMGNKDYRRRFDYGSKFIDNNGLCVYCGARATCLDHFVPLSVLYSLSGTMDTTKSRWKLEACHECNGIVGAKVFKTFYEKINYVHKMLEDKYYKFLEMPDWGEDELSELGYGLRGFVESGINNRKFIYERLKWKTRDNPAHAILAEIRFSSTGTGNDFVIRGAPSIGTTKIEKELSMNTTSTEAVSTVTLKTNKKTCDNCGLEIITTRPWKRFCNSKCSQNWHYAQRRKMLDYLCPKPGFEDKPTEWEEFQQWKKRNENPTSS